MSVTELWERPVIVAPMGGGSTTAKLIAAAAEAGALAFLPGAYKPASDLHAEIGAVRALTDRPFGVNVFTPGRPAADPAALERYVRELSDDAAELRCDVGEPRWDDDDWEAKIEVLIEAAPAVVSFTFGCPAPQVIEAIQRRGSRVMVTVTSLAEAEAATRAGATMLCAQGIEAGAHRGTFDDRAFDEELPMLELVSTLTRAGQEQVVAAGGIATPADVVAALRAGAIAIQAGTAFLLCEEAGTNPVHRAALEAGRARTTVLTRAFTGRRARGLDNDFMRRHPNAPSAFPEIHNATRGLRAAAASAGDADRLHLWAGTGHRHTRAAPAGDIIAWLAGDAGEPASRQNPAASSCTISGSAAAAASSRQR